MFGFAVKALGAVFGLIVTIFIFSWLVAPLKVFSPSNVALNYSFFHDASRTIDARVAQVRAMKTTVTDANARIELAAVQQSCRELVGKYNANASKIHVGVFQNGVPSFYDMKVCE